MVSMWYNSAMFKTLRPYILQYKWLLAVSYGTAVVQSAIASLMPLMGKVFFDYVLISRVPQPLIDRLISMNMPRSAVAVNSIFTNVYIFALAVLVFTLLMSGLKLVRGLADFRLQNDLTASLNADIYASLLAADLKKHQTYEKGYLSFRVMADAGAFEALARNLLPSMVNNVLKFLIGLAVLSSINLPMTLVCFVVAPVYLLINWLFSGRVRRLAHQSAEVAAENQAFLQKTLDGVETLKAFNLEYKRVSDFKTRLNEMIAIRLQYFLTGKLSSGLARFVQILSMLILLVMTQEYHQQGLLSVGDIITFTGYMGFLAGPLSGLAMLYINLQPSMVSLKRVHEMLNLAPEEPACDFLNMGEKNHKQIRKRPGCLAVKNLCYSHNSDKYARFAFSDLSVEFHRGEMALIDWPSGAGKTTLARLLMRFLEPAQGSIEIDGIPYTEISRRQLRAMIGYRPQSDFFFAGSVRDNLLVAAPEADDEMIVKTLQLCCADFVMGYSDGIEHMLKDGAVNLSEGQRARLSLARVVMRDPGIVILDEPFAAIDQATADRIMHNLKSFFAERITIILSHRKAGEAL